MKNLIVLLTTLALAASVADSTDTIQTESEDFFFGFFSPSKGSNAQSQDGNKDEKPEHCEKNRYRINKAFHNKRKCPLEVEINNQIKMELDAFYEYLNLGYYFAHEEYNLPHFSKYFLDNANEELKHAQDLMKYQVLRGAHVNLMNVAAPTKKSFSSSCDAMKHAYDLELKVTKQIEAIWKKADDLMDVHLTDHLETHFITEQYESLKKLKDMMGTLNRLGICDRLSSHCDKLGEFQFDKTVMKDLTSK